MFPDAPTERGIKHLLELAESVKDGYKAMVVFIIQMEGIKYFTPNHITHKAFADTLKEVKNKGVQILALDCEISKTTIEAKNFVEVRL